MSIVAYLRERKNLVETSKGPLKDRRSYVMASRVPDGTKNGKLQFHRAINIKNLTLARKQDVTMGGRAVRLLGPS